MLDCEQTAKLILINVGGISNYDYSMIDGLGIKIIVKNPRLVNMTALERIDGVFVAFNMYDSISLILDYPYIRSIAGALDKLVASERYREKKDSVTKLSPAKQKATSLVDVAELFCPVCNNRLIGKCYCSACNKIVTPPTLYQKNDLPISKPYTDIYKVPLNVSTTNEQNRSVTINNYNIYIENLNINGLTFNQIIQCNGSNQQVLKTITDRVVVFENFITYITRRIQNNNEMAWDVIIILKSDADAGIRSLGDSMQRESRVGRNPLAKLRSWILQHKDDMVIAKKFFDALSSAASFAQKWGPWLAKVVGV